MLSGVDAVVHVIGLACVGAIALGLPALTAVQPVVPAEPAPARIAVAVLVAGPLDYRDLEDALRIRLPRLRTLPWERRTQDELRGEAYAYVELSQPEAPPGALDVTVILTDGRSYGRRFVPDPTDPIRDTATMVINTLTAIEEERVAPIRDDAAIPEPAAPAVKPAVAEPTDTPPQVPSPVPQARPTASLGTTASSEPRAPRIPDRWAVGIAPDLGGVVGVAPAPAGAFGGGAVALGLLARAPSGAVVALATRWTGHRDGDLRLSRFRVLLGGGYAWRRESFELLVVAGATVEPWIVTAVGGRARPTLDRAANRGTRTSPMIGGLGRVSPGLRLQPTPTVAARVGLYGEAAASALPSGGAARIVVDEGGADARPLARMGGLELSAGLDATLWFSLGPR